MMRTFNGNLDAYHALNALNDIYVRQQEKKGAEASTPEQMEAIMREDEIHFQEQKKLYKELGEEMKEIMSKKWWQFWK